MTNAQTEARAILRKVLAAHRKGNSASAPIATALAAKDAELAAEHAALRLAADRADRAEAQLAEALKALDALDRMSRGVDWCDQDEQARRWSAARRALAGGE